MHLSEAYAWLAERPRVAYPQRVSKSLSTLHSSWAYWIRVTELGSRAASRRQHLPRAGLDAEIQGQVIRIYSEGVQSVRLYLSPAMLDLESEVTVEWNGRELFSAVPERSVQVLLETAVEKVDWTGSFEAALDLTTRR